MEPNRTGETAPYRTGFCDLPREVWTARRTALNKIEMTGPEVESPFPLTEAVPSWNLIAGPHGWAEIFLRGRKESAWTEWYPLGLWASGDGPVRRSSPGGMEDDLGMVKTDVIRFKEGASSLQMRIILSELRAGGAPLFRHAALTWSSDTPKAPLPPGEEFPGEITLEGIPAHSQMVYADGGRGWCSPTSLSMVIAYWRKITVPPEAAVREAVAGVFDPLYGGTGNWSFNAAWAGSLGYRACLRRFSRFVQLRPYLEKGIPLIISIAFDNGEDRPLTGAPMERSSGHLILLRGFDGRGGALVHEPAAPCALEVPRTYPCAELEARWLEASGGLAYIIHPEVLPEGIRS